MRWCGLRVIGLDVGGANIKAAFVEVRGKELIRSKILRRYFPIWKEGKEKLPKVLSEVVGSLVGEEAVDAAGLTMTAEVSDAYFVKREGVHHVIDSVKEVLHEVGVHVCAVGEKLLSPEEAKQRYMEVASANWVATGWMVAQHFPDCVVVDIGSTTTTITPVLDERVAAQGLNDLEKLMCGELVYTGVLRTNVAAIVQRVPLRGAMVRVSSELFATSGDVYLVLGRIAPEDFSVETADGRGVSRVECLARLSRIVCADLDMLSEDELVEIAEYVYEKQLSEVCQALHTVYERACSEADKLLPVVVLGLGSFLAEEAAKRVGVEKVVKLDELVGKGVSGIGPALGVALMVVHKLTGARVGWMRL